MNSKTFTNRVFDRVLGESSVETRSQPGARPGPVTRGTPQSDAYVQGLDRIASVTDKGKKKVRGTLDTAIANIRKRKAAL